MSKYQIKVITTYGNLQRPNQTYENLEIWINIDGRQSFLTEMYLKECDIFGIVPIGLDFASDQSIEHIVDIFEQDINLRYLISQEETNGNKALFCRKNLVDKDGSGFDFDASKETDLISIKGLFNIYG
jgi:hypothetical protein|tara:strand:+ start:2517 stop:2900 length:384 start_codon:yes stop_codon:yes gene_type:complete